jgi:NADP-dependent 3-hydroxy acid dehydrogenase YdfG
MTTHENTFKTILITGASTGFGPTKAETLVRAGHCVFATMRDIGNRNKANADELKCPTAAR